MCLRVSRISFLAETRVAFSCSTCSLCEAGQPEFLPDILWDFFPCISRKVFLGHLQRLTQDQKKSIEKKILQKKMCSNTSTSGGGNSAGGWTMGSNRPPKRQKVPKRGPGVAELEKILREQEKKDTNAEAAEKGHSLRFVSSLASPYYSQSLNSEPRQLLPPVAMRLHPATATDTSPSSSLAATNLAQFNPPLPPPMTIIYADGSSKSLRGTGNGGGCGGGGGGGGVCVVGGSGVAPPEQALFAITWGSCKLNMDRVDGSNSGLGTPLPTLLSSETNPQCSSPNLPQAKQFQYPATMLNHDFSGPGIASLLTVSSAGMYHYVEPPSNQRASHNYSHSWPKQEKVLGMRGPKPFSFGNTPGPQFHVQVPLVIDSGIPRPEKSSSCDNRIAFDFDPADTTSRDKRWGGPLDSSSEKCITDDGEPRSNFYTFVSPSISSPTTQLLKGEFSKFDLLPIQEGVEDSHQRSESYGVDGENPFHGFSQQKEQTGRKALPLSLNNERGEAEGGRIDLNLKL